MDRLNPSCSEIICRLDDEELRVFTDSHPNELLDFLLSHKEPISAVEYLDNIGGGGDWDYIERMVEIHKYFAEGRITGEQLEELDEFVWENKKLPDFLVADGKLYIEPTPEELCCLLMRNPKNVFYRFEDEERRRLVKIYGRYQGNKTKLKAKLLSSVL
ncbi:MAG: hypothetical protein QW356_02055 [Candidatus Hadarchaeales archaeon]